jgi:hypothetical protein
VTVAAALTIGAGDLTLTSGDFSLGGIAMATFGAIIVYQVLQTRSGRPFGCPPHYLASSSVRITRHLRTHKKAEAVRPPPFAS